MFGEIDHTPSRENRSRTARQIGVRQMRPDADAPRWRKKIFELYLSGDLRKGRRFVGGILFLLAILLSTLNLSHFIFNLCFWSFLTDCSRMWENVF